MGQAPGTHIYCHSIERVQYTVRSTQMLVLECMHVIPIGTEFCNVCPPIEFDKYKCTDENSFTLQQLQQDSSFNSTPAMQATSV